MTTTYCVSNAFERVRTRLNDGKEVQALPIEGEQQRTSTDKKMRFIDSIVDGIARQPSEQRPRLVDALRTSLAWSDDSGRLPKSPGELHALSGVPVEVLMHVGIVMTKPDVQPVATELGFKLSLGQVKRRLEAGTVQEKLKRGPDKLGVKNIYTIGEVLFLFGYLNKVAIPNIEI